MKKTAFSLLLLFFSQIIYAQESTSAFNFLKLPTSSHAAALGGTNISIIEDDPTLAWNNPALLSSVSDKSLNLNYMTYLSSSKLASASFVKAMGERHTLGVTAQMLDYGSMDETSETGQVIGSVNAKDMMLQGLYSYTLSGRWVGGATAKFIYSKYAAYSSFAMAVDLGLNYYDEDASFSSSIVLKNIGAQLSSFHENTEHLPFDMQIGFSQDIAHAPIRLSLTLVDLTRWSKKYYYNYVGGDIKAGKMIMNHVVFGADIFLGKNFSLSAGYNFRRAAELKAAGSAHGAGWSFGGNMQLKKFKAGISYAKYHIAASSLLFNVTYSL